LIKLHYSCFEFDKTANGTDPQQIRPHTGVIGSFPLLPLVFGLLSWGYLIFNNLTPLYENKTELDEDITVFSRAAV